MRITLQWPLVSARIVMRKLLFQGPQCTLAIEDVYSVSLVSQCRMLEASLKTDIVCQCLKHPHKATAIVHSNKTLLLDCDFILLISTSPPVSTNTH